MDPVIYIDEKIKTCVERTSVKLLPSLQIVDPNITAVHFQHGHPLEIIKILEGLSAGVTTKTERYPLVALFRDFKETMGQQPGVYSQSNPIIIIATRTDPNYSSDQRREISFKKVLHPIMVELYKQFELSGYFLTEGNDLQSVERIDHYFWGKESLYGVKANIFNDMIDCVELNNTNLKLYTNDCQ